MKLKNILNPVYVFKNRDLIKPALTDIFKQCLKFFHLQWIRACGIPLTENDRKIAALKDTHLGRRCFIIGNGPSLKIKDLDRLRKEITFASNKIYLAFDQTTWRPTYYSVYDILVAENNKSNIDKLNLYKIFGENIRPYFNKNSAIWLRGLKVPIVNDEYECRFSTNSLEGGYGGWTVIYLQMQLAFYMGIREIYLIGVDFSFEIPKSTGERCASGKIIKHQGETNHFHPEYRKPGETWTMPLLDLQYKAFVNAKKTIGSHGGKIFNASRKTALDVFPHVDFDSIFN